MLIFLIFKCLFCFQLAQTRDINWIYSLKLQGKRIYISNGHSLPAHNWEDAAALCADSNGAQAQLANLNDPEYEKAVVEELRKDVANTGENLGKYKNDAKSFSA